MICLMRSYLEQFLSVFSSGDGYVFHRFADELGQLCGYMRDIAAFVSLAAERYRSQIGRVCFQYDPVQWNRPDGFCYRGFLVGEDSSDSDIPVAETVDLAPCLCAAAVCVEDTLERKMSVFLEDVQNQPGGFPGMNDYREIQSGGQLQLDSEYLLLLFDEFFRPVAVHSDFTYRKNLS